MKTAWGKDSYSELITRIDLTKEEVQQIEIALSGSIDSAPHELKLRLRKLLKKISDSEFFKPDTCQELSAGKCACKACVKKMVAAFPEYEITFDFERAVFEDNCNYCGNLTFQFIKSYKMTSR